MKWLLAFTEKKKTLANYKKSTTITDGNHCCFGCCIVNYNYGWFLDSILLSIYRERLLISCIYWTQGRDITFNFYENRFYKCSCLPPSPQKKAFHIFYSENCFRKQNANSDSTESFLISIYFKKKCLVNRIHTKIVPNYEIFNTNTGY